MPRVYLYDHDDQTWLWIGVDDSVLRPYSNPTARNAVSSSVGSYLLCREA